MLIVRCPACHTVFRVRPEQLRAHGGRVRCGSCQGAFNAVEHLMDQARIPDVNTQKQQTETPPPDVTTPERQTTPLEVADKLDFGIPEPVSTAQNLLPCAPNPDTQPGTEFRPYIPPRPAPPPPDLFAPKPPPAIKMPAASGASPWTDEPDTEPAPVPPEPATQPAETRPPDPEHAVNTPLLAEAPTTADTGADRLSPFVVRDEDPEDSPPASEQDETAETANNADADAPAFLYHTEPQVKHRWLWGLVTGMLAGTLAVQAAYLFREDIARKWPQTRPWYLELCVHLGCTVPLPRVASAITIESSNLETDPGDARQFILSARVRNQAHHPQQYPHLELTLTDGRDRPVVRRVITPDEWVPGGGSDAGMAPRAEIEASVPFAATGPVSAVGYRVYAFYP